MITAIRLQNPTADSSPVETDSIFSPPFSFIPEPELLPGLLSFPESGFSGFAGFSGLFPDQLRHSSVAGSDPSDYFPSIVLLQ